MIFKTRHFSFPLIEQCIVSVRGLKVAQKEFISTTLCLFLSIKGRINFSQLARYSGKCEQYFRGHFSKGFDFLRFNKSLLKKVCSTEVILAFDPSYIKKSGKHTEGLSRFWSGCAGKVKRGLEICGIAALDVTAHTALHLLAVQTIPLAGETLMDFYVRIFKERAEQLQEVSKTIVCDAYFSKFTFCEPLIKIGFSIISRLRKAIQIARLIILNYSPDIKSNNENMLAILFDMNKLWEEYVYHLLQRAARRSEFKVSFQNSMKFWEHKTIRPDIVIESLNDATKYIIDAKWKIVDSSNPSDDDLKQMFAYNIYWGASRSILLYPEVLEQDETFGKFHHKAGMDNNSCKLGFVNILNSEGSLDLEAGVSIFEKLKL